MSDAKYFSRGKAQEFQDELKELNKKKDTSKSLKETKKILKKVVANITMGNDMSALAVEVIGLLSIPEVDLKKMIYLFIVSYASQKPEIAEAAIPFLASDTRDENPLIRVLAIRTMSNIPVEKVWLAACEPIRRALVDKDPYVCKTAAISVAKLFSYHQDVVQNEGLLDKLTALLNHGNANVVANAVLSLMDIASISSSFAFSLNVPTANKLLTALDESSEWSQCYLMESLMTVFPDDPLEAELLADRIAPRLQHANSAIVLSAVRIMIHLSSFLKNPDQISSIVKKCGPPLVTLLHGPFEVQYVALKNIQLILQKHKYFLKSEIKVFFCKYNDPIYVKLSKLDILFQSADESNVFSLLPELKEYSQEVDVDFVRKAVRSIGRCAVKIEASADKCVETLVDLIETKVDYVVQEAIVVIKDIFRKYPNRFESIIRILCENLSSLEEQEAKSSMIWIIGQYSDRINNADQLLSGFLNSFKEETSIVQLSLLTAIVKLFIKRPALGQSLVPQVLKYSTEEVDNPDLRDRGFMYWRLLSTNPVAAKTIVFGDKPTIDTESDNFDPSLLSRLLYNLSTLSSLSHRPTIISQDLANILLKNYVDSKKILDNAVMNNQSQPTSIPITFTNDIPLQNNDKPVQVMNDLNQLSLLDEISNQSKPPLQQQILNNGLPIDLFSNSDNYPVTNIPQNRSISPDLFSAQNSNLNQSSRSSLRSAAVPSGNPFSSNQEEASLHNPFASMTQNSLMISSENSHMPYVNPFSSMVTFQMEPSLNPNANQSLNYGLNHVLQVDSNVNTIIDPFSRTSNSKTAPTTNTDTMSPKILSISGFSTLPILLSTQLGHGLEIRGKFSKRNGRLYLDMNLINNGAVTLKEFSIIFNKNSFGLTTALLMSIQPLFPNQSADCSLPVNSDSLSVLSTPPNMIQVALKNNTGVFYFSLFVPLYFLFKEGCEIPQQAWLNLWKGELSNNECKSSYTVGISLASILNKLQSNRFSIVAERQIENKTVIFGSATILDGTVFLAEIQIDTSNSSCTITCKTLSNILSPIFNDSIADLFNER